MATNVDELTLKITAVTSEASAKINELKAEIQSLKSELSSVDTSGIKSIKSDAQQMATSVKQATDSAKQSIEDLTSSMKTVGESASEVAQEMQEMGNIPTIVSAGADKVKEFAESFQELDGGITKSNMTMKQIENRIDSLRVQYNKLLTTTKEKIASDGSFVDSQAFEDAQSKLRMIKQEMDELNAKKAKMESSGKGSSLGFNFTGLSQAFRNVGGAIDDVTTRIKKHIGGLHSSEKATKEFDVSNIALAKSLFRVGKMLKLMITRKALRAVLSKLTDGFKNLAQASSSFDADVSLLWNSLRQLGNAIASSVAPVLGVFKTNLNGLIQYLVKAVNAVNQLISALTGNSTWQRAKTLTDSYADSLETASEKAKKLKKTVLGFDEINQLQDKDTSSGTKPADMFETAQVESKWLEIADKIKKAWKQITAPIKKAWAKMGDFVKDSWTKAFESIKKVVLDVGNDFLEVWNQPQTVQIFENILKIIGDIGLIASNLADAFDRAWQKNETGKKILEDIRDIFGTIIQHVTNIVDSWVKWTENIDLSPLMTSIEEWLESLNPVVDAVSGVVESFNTEFLQPFMSWLVEKGIPSLIDVFTEFNDKVEWDVIKERLDKVWTALEPFAEKVGEGLITFVEDIADDIANFLNSDGWDSFIDTLVTWTDEIDADDIADGLKLIAGAFVAWKTVPTIINTISNPLYAFATLIASLTMVIDTFVEDYKKWKEAVGGDSFLDSLFNGDKDAKKQIADAKGSNPYKKGSYTAQIEEVKELREQFKNGAIDANEYYNAIKDYPVSVIGNYDAHKRQLYEWNNAVTEVTDNVQDNVIDVFGENGTLITSVKQSSKTSQTETVNMKTYYADLSKSISAEYGTITKSTTSFADETKKAFDKSNWTFSGVKEGLSETFSSAVDNVKSIWNELADKLSGDFNIGSKSFSINLPKFKGYATGGFPEDGFFYANHNELVGKFSNGKTAVANNEQITQGIAQAVYQAMMSANASSNSNASYINNTIQIDGETIARAVTRGQASRDRRFNPSWIG